VSKEEHLSSGEGVNKYSRNSGGDESFVFARATLMRRKQLWILRKGHLYKVKSCFEDSALCSSLKPLFSWIFLWADLCFPSSFPALGLKNNIKS